MRYVVRCTDGVVGVYDRHQDVHIACGDALSRGAFPSITSISDAIPSEGGFFKRKPFDTEAYLKGLREQQERIELRELEALLGMLKQQRSAILNYHSKQGAV